MLDKVQAKHVLKLLVNVASIATLCDIAGMLRTSTYTCNIIGVSSSATHVKCTSASQAWNVVVMNSVDELYKRHHGMLGVCH